MEQQSKHWYIVQTLSGHELKAASLLKDIIKERGFEDLIEEVVVPTEKVIENVNGRVRRTESKLYPGYIFINMVMNFATFDLVKNTNYIISFLGQTKGKLPDPIGDHEADRIFSKLEETQNAPRQKTQFDVGEKVRVISGPFADFTGEVESVDYDKAKLTLSISIFGRVTPIEIEFIQVEKSV